MTLIERLSASEGSVDAVRDLVVIASSSRGGSSIVAEALRRQPGLLHFRAEVNPFFLLAGLGPATTGSDALTAAHLDDPRIDTLRRLLRADLGQPTTTLGPADRPVYAQDLADRLQMQWPDRDLPADTVADALHDALRRAHDDLGWVDEVPDARLLHVYLFAELARRGHALDPYAYDVDHATVARLLPDARFGAFTPTLPIWEEPPYVAIPPWRRATDAQLATLPVIMKTPSNVWRLPFLRGLFPGARFRVLHLTRNVAAAVNGLYDGWNYPGFHSHRLAHGWWKFDLPPGWEGWVDVPLEQRCAWLWRGAHLQILRFLRELPPDDQFRCRFESLLQGEPPDALAAWLGVPLPADLLGAAPPVMATEPPRRRRWFARAGLLGPILADPENRFVMEALGYADDPDTWL